jgi:hypothetical protein
VSTQARSAAALVAAVALAGGMLAAGNSVSRKLDTDPRSGGLAGFADEERRAHSRIL